MVRTLGSKLLWLLVSEKKDLNNVVFWVTKNVYPYKDSFSFPPLLFL